MVEQHKAPPNKIIYADPGHCLGCHACEMACAVAHSEADDLFEAAALEGLRPRTHVVAVDGDCVPIQCRQCEEAPCAKVCPTSAMRQEGSIGTVHVEIESCIGCKLCTMVCPFGAVSVPSVVKSDGRRRGGVATKCDLCTEWRVRVGSDKTACEQACPTRAVKLVDLESYRAALVRARAAEVAAAHRAQAARMSSVLAGGDV